MDNLAVEGLQVMSSFEVKIDDSELQEMMRKLEGISEVDYKDAVKLTATSIYNRGQSGGTPVRTGELRQSMGTTDDEGGYTKDYAPHVEYGHRTRNGGYVEGQHYLQNNVNAEEPEFKNRIKNILKGIVG